MRSGFHHRLRRVDGGGGGGILPNGFFKVNVCLSTRAEDCRALLSTVVSVNTHKQTAQTARILLTAPPAAEAPRSSCPAPESGSGGVAGNQDCCILATLGEEQEEEEWQGTMEENRERRRRGKGGR